MKYSNTILIYLLLALSPIFLAEVDYYKDGEYEFRARGLGQFGYPSDPASDRAKGYLLEGKVKNAVSNYGEFIEWDHHPAGLWGEFTYLPDVAMVAGVRGHKYSSDFEDWIIVEMEGEGSWNEEHGENLYIWCSVDLYDEWNLNPEELTTQDALSLEEINELSPRVNGRFVGIVFDVWNAEKDGSLKEFDDRGKEGIRVASRGDLTEVHQWTFDLGESVESGNNSRVCMALRKEESYDNPNNSDVMIGIMYPWALRPVLQERDPDRFDIYEYGNDQLDWSFDDDYEYYGATSQESWFTRLNPSSNTDWQPTQKARQNTHGTEYAAGDLFSDTDFSDPNDTYPLLAHSSDSRTWPKKFDEEKGEYVSYWPGTYARQFNKTLKDSTIENPASGFGCEGANETELRKDDDCWETVEGRFVSDNDVYIEFDDRWAHRGNRTKNDKEYLQAGYPLGLRVKATAHSYGVSFAEDIMFVTVWVINESGDYLDEELNLYEGMIMPDGTKLNAGAGFDYEDMVLGFYMDADVLTATLNNSFSVHTNDDDFMEYVDCKTSKEYYPNGCPLTANGTEELRVSIAVIGDWDGNSNSAYGYSMDPAAPDGNDFGLVAVQMLDSPNATEDVDLDQDGFVDIYGPTPSGEPGEKLKMTDWHWFDWYNRPGVVYREGEAGCCAGDFGKDQAWNKEEIQYKVMAGDTTNLTDDEKSWYFHADPTMDELDPNFNPHFDSVDDLEKTEFFTSAPDGLDCVMEMTCGPFDLAVRDSVPFSFCIIFGENMEDLLSNAEFAQVMYNAKYQGFNPPETPIVEAEASDEQVKLYWDMKADSSIDVVSGYYDFEGYKIYKSTDGGTTWGADSSRILDNTGIEVGWKPIKSFDLSYLDDYYHCVKTPQIGDCDDIILPDGSRDTYRSKGISGYDSYAPWFSLGENTGLPSEYDEHEDSGIECEVSDAGEISCRYYYIDYNVMNGIEYTYSVTSYDTGISDSLDVNGNPDGWAKSTNGYQLIECSKGTTNHNKNFITIIPGAQNTGNSCDEVRVIPNPYLSRSQLNETEYERRISFMDLPEKYTLNIYTVTGEHVWSQDETYGYAQDGLTFWRLRSINNQEVSPGLYIYTIDAEEGSGNSRKSVCKHIGKFAIVR